MFHNFYLLINVHNSNYLVFLDYDVWTDDENIIVELHHKIHNSLNNIQPKYNSCYYNYLECEMEPLFAYNV